MFPQLSTLNPSVKPALSRGVSLSLRKPLKAVESGLLAIRRRASYACP